MTENKQTIGLLGGGQLGTFFCVAAKQLGFKVSVWDPDPNAPAHAWADHSIISPFDDAQACRDFIAQNAVVTYEWENIPLTVLEKIEEYRPLHPGSGILKQLQNRISEKDFLSTQGFPIADYRPFFNTTELTTAIASLGWPIICKTATDGYDGIGQKRINSESDLILFSEEFQPTQTGWVAEKVIDFTQELSVLVARNAQGHCVSYPLAENEHDAGILRRSQIPARCDQSIQEKAQALCESVVKALQGVGLFCIELFLLKDGSLLINEIAPRPHNSGHTTLDATSCSQFEMQVRAVCGLPLVAPQLQSQAIMLNVLGSEILALRTPVMRDRLLSLPGVHLYDYRKTAVTPRRKMGHITLTEIPHSLLSEREHIVREVLNAAAQGRS